MAPKSNIKINATPAEIKLARYAELVELGKVANSSFDFRRIQKESSKRMKKLLDCEFVLLYLLDKPSKQLVLSTFENESDAGPVQVVPISEASFAGACAYYNAILNIADATSDIRSKRSFSNSAMIKNAMLAPICFEGEVLGVIEAINANQGFFDHEEESFIEIATSTLAISINNYNLFESYKNQFIQVCEAMGDAVVHRDKYTGGHTKRVGIFSEMIGRELGLSFKEMNDLRLSAVLHDLGKIGMPDSILKKEQHLTLAETEFMRNHPRVGFEILGHIDGLQNVVDGVRYHHERFDGLGYPYGLKGDQIPLIAQIIAVADTFDAMISNRPYRKGLSPMVAHQEILDNAGTQFSYRVVEAFDRAFKKSHMYRPDNVVILKKVA